MISFQALGVRFRLPLVTLLAPVLAARLGMRGGGWALALSLCAHELGHLLAAKLVRVEIREIRILPIGGSIRMENPYGLSPAQLAVTAIAGPSANLALMLLCASFAQWGLLAPAQATGTVRTSLALLIFNLLPALPLDGGRVLYALLYPRLGAQRALKVGIQLGRLLATALLTALLALRLQSGKWNLSFLLAAVFLLSSGRDERSALLRSRAELLEETLSPDEPPRPARLYQLDGQTRASNALRLLRPKESTWFVLTENGVPCGLLDGRSLAQQAMENADEEIKNLKIYTFELLNNNA